MNKGVFRKKSNKEGRKKKSNERGKERFYDQISYEACEGVERMRLLGFVTSTITKQHYKTFVFYLASWRTLSTPICRETSSPLCVRW